jgi:hypothetical protein
MFPDLAMYADTRLRNSDCVRAFAEGDEATRGAAFDAAAVGDGVEIEVEEVP